MTYADYINRLLAPLGVYALDETTVSGAMVQALGAELDEIWAQLQAGLENAFPQTASASALPIWEQLLPSAGVADDHRMAAVRAVATNGSAECTSAHLAELLSAAGLSATISCTKGVLSFGGEDAEQAAVFLAPFLPAHIQYPPEEE